MQTKTLSNNTFENNSFDNWQTKRCDFCMYHELIFDQLERLKQAVLIKNQRIKQLEEFIAKISEMAFVKSPLVSNLNAFQNIVSQKQNESSQSFQNQSSGNILRGMNNQYFKKRFEESSEISFSQSKRNTAKFQNKLKQGQSGLNGRFQKINELNQMKKQLKLRFKQTVNKQNIQISEKVQDFNGSNQFDTLRTLSQPQQQGQIGSIPQSSCQNSRISELGQRKIMFQNEQIPQISTKEKLIKTSSSKEQETKNSIDIIKRYLKQLK